MAAAFAGLFVYYLLIHYSILSAESYNPFTLLFVISSLAINIFSGFYYSKHKHFIPNFIPFLGNIFLILLIPGILIHSYPKSHTYFNLYFSTNFFVALILVVLLIMQGKRFVIPRTKEIKSSGIISYSLMSFVSGILFILLMRSDYWVVGYLCTDIDMGNYIQTSKFVQSVMLLPTMASFALFPLLSQSIHNGSETEYKVFRIINIYIFISLIICIAVCATGFYLFPLLYGNTFDKMYKIFLLLIPGVIALAASYPLNIYFSVKKHIHINLAGMLLGIAIMIGSDFLLIPHIGIYGAAAGCSLGYIFYLLFLIYHYKKKASFSVFELVHPGLFLSEINKLFTTKTDHEN
jgi:O-antigen/teichoic acid export membrane protein